MDEEQQENIGGGEDDLGLGAKVAQAGVATPAELKAIVAGTNLGLHFEETAEDYFVANASHKAAAERVNPAMSKLIARLGPLANRVEVLGMNRRNRERARTFLGGDLSTDDRDLEAIQRLKNRLGIDRIREKYRTTTKMLAAYTGQHHLLLASEHIGDALRYAEHQQFDGIEFSYNGIDGDRWAKVISEAVVGEFSGIYAAAILWQGIAAERAKVSRDLKMRRQSRREELAGTSLVPLATVGGTSTTTDETVTPETAEPVVATSETEPVVAKPEPAEPVVATSETTESLDEPVDEVTAEEPIAATPAPAAIKLVAGRYDARQPDNDTVAQQMAARSPVSSDTVLDSMSDEALTMLLLRRHNPTIGAGRYAILDIIVEDGQVTFKGRLV